MSANVHKEMTDGSPLRKSIFDVVQRSVHQNTAVVPSGGLDPDSFVDQSTLPKGFVGDRDGYRLVSSILYSGTLSSLCLLNRATMFPSALQTTYLTGGVLSSANVFCCWISNRTTEVGAERSKEAVPP